MTVSYRTGITILQIIFFIPSLCVAVYLCFQNGLKSAGTWRFIATLSALRVAGDVSYFISLNHPSLDVEVSVIVCELMGLAPLMLVLVALVGRVNKITHSFPVKAPLVISLLSLTGLIVGIVGTNNALHDAETTNSVGVNALMRAAVALFLAGFGLMLFSFFMVVFDVKMHPAKGTTLGREMRVLYIVGLAAPFVLVRLVYGAIGDFTGNREFSVLYGNNTIYLCMGILMEIIAITLVLSIPFLVPERSDKSEGPQNNAEENGSSETTSETK
ncbi:hypothetical protein NLU13_9650 [Sarocladium strictum]|uniref:DUF7702 domain-containing protein n=1 Tax=Sarocladium strictum TaxID=5046 RepID=A0AA39GBX0_SARSR|nr:hypothetical protein NLU13_9650 [Sarocladium strictum]